MAFELPDLDGLMGASGRMKMNGYPIEWGVGRHSGPGNNVYSFFVDPNGIATEYTTDMEQVDDATYPHRTAEDWRNMPIQPCTWGMGIERTEKLLRATHRQDHRGAQSQLHRGDFAAACELASATRRDQAALLPASLRQPMTCLRVLQSGQTPRRTAKRSVSSAAFMATRLAISNRSTRQLSQ